MPRTRIAPTTATGEAVQIKTTDGAANANMVASQPPTTAPTILRIAGQEKSTSSRPGMISLAIMPAIRSKIIQCNNSHVQASFLMNRTEMLHQRSKYRQGRIDAGRMSADLRTTCKKYSRICIKFC